MAQVRDKVFVFRDAAGDWRWHRKAANGLIIATSGEGYRNKAFAVQMAKRVNKFVKIRVED